MNWFQRYGIPGMFFYAHAFAYVGVFYLPRLKVLLKSDYANVLPGLIAATFLPIGYFLIVIQQFFYMKYCGQLRKINSNLNFPNCAKDEWMNEAYWTYSKYKYGECENIKQVQDFSRKRNDQIAISNAIITAIIPSILFGLFVPLFLSWPLHSPGCKFIYLLLDSIAVATFLCFVNKKRNEQMIYLLKLVANDLAKEK